MLQKQLVRLGILHVQISCGNMHYNHKILSQAMAIAAGYGCDAVVTGELIECGALFWRKVELQSVPAKMYPYFNHLQETAYKYKMHILIGRAERDWETGKLYSNYTHINEKGEAAAECRKQIIECPEESKYLSQDRNLIWTQIGGVKAALFIGYNEQIKKLMLYCKEQGIDLMICAVSPVYHGNLRKEVSSMGINIQPVIFCSYNMNSDEIDCIGESIYLGTGKGSVLRIQGSHVMVVDYDKKSKSFQLVKIVDVDEILQ